MIEKLLLGILDSVGVPLVLKLIAGTTPQEQVQAILDGEYKAAEEAAKAAEDAKFGAQ